MLKKLNDTAKKVLSGEKRKGRVCITLVDDKFIRQLNKKFRKTDKATDVLSFEMGEDGILGDIVISQDSAQKNANRFGVSLTREMKRLVIHGVLHLLGFDHKDTRQRRLMRQKEDEYIKKTAK